MFVHRRKYTSRVIILFVKASRSIIHRPFFYVIFYESKNRQMNARNKYVSCRLCAQSNLWSANLRYRTSIESQQLDIGSSLRRTSDLNQNPKLPSHPLLFGLTLPFPLSPSLFFSLSTFDSHSIFGAEWTRRSHPQIPYNNASLIRHVCSAAEYTIVAATVSEMFR